jgi:type IV secretion system protein VirB8
VSDDAYLIEARSWDIDRAARAQRSARLGWTVGSCIGAAGVLIAVVALVHVGGTVREFANRPPPYIAVNEILGTAEYRAPIDGKTRQDWPETDQQLRLYTIWRESYFWGVAEAYYQWAQARNATPLAKEMSALWDDANPESPTNLYKDGTIIATKVVSVSPLPLGSGRDNFAQIRYLTEKRKGGTGAAEIKHWIATVEYAYAPAKKGETVDPLNAVGFRVLEFRREPEVANAITTAEAAK